MKNTISEWKNTVEEIKSRRSEAEDGISELEDQIEKNTQKEKKKDKRLRKNKRMVRELQENMKHNNIHIIGIPEGEEEEQGIESLFAKVMMENFPNLRREKSSKSSRHRESQARGTQRGPLQDTS